MNEALLTKLQAARSEAERHWPYVASILFNLKLVRVDDKSFTTLGVDKGWRLYWSPDFVEKCSTVELATAILHECLHCLFEHSVRFERLVGLPRDIHTWNVAGDCAINHILDQDGFVFPSHITPIRFADFNGSIVQEDSTETNYAKLLELDSEQVFHSVGQGEKAEPGSDQKDPAGADNAPGDQAGDDKTADSGQPSQPAEQRSFQTDCGSIAGGDRREYELDADDQSLPAIDESAKSVAKADVAKAITVQTTFGRRANSSLVRAVDELLTPRVSWRRQLSVLLKSSLGNIMGRSDYTLMRISRRDSSLKSKNFNPRFPAMRGPKPPKVAVILDTSPSISDKNIKDALSEILGIVRSVGASKSVAVIPCSYNAYEPQFVKTPKQVAYIRPIGDEGTDLRKGFDVAMKLRSLPDVIVVITDGETPWPDDKPQGLKLALVLLSNKRFENNLRPWMTSIIQEG